MDDKDTAIIELAHTAENLLKAARDAGIVPGILNEAISNKIEFYRRFASSA